MGQNQEFILASHGHRQINYNSRTPPLTTLCTSNITKFDFFFTAWTVKGSKDFPDFESD